MAYSIIQTGSGNGGGYVQNWTKTMTFTAGSGIIIAFAAGEAESPVITDNQSQTWTELNEVVNVGDRRAELWWLGSATGGSKTINFYSGGNYADSAAYIFEVTGLQSTPLDVFAEATADGATSHPSGSTAALTQINELIVGMMAATNAVPGITGDASYGSVYSQAGADSWTSIHVQFKAPSSTAGQSYTPTTSGGTSSSVMCVALKETGSTVNTTNFFQFI